MYPYMGAQGYAQQGYGYGQMGYGMGQQSMVQSNGYPGTQPMAYPGATQMPTTNINPMGGAVPRNLGASLQPNARPSFVQSIIRPGQLISSGQQPVPGNPVPYSGAVSTTGTMQGAAPHAAPGSTGGMNAPGSQSTAPGSGSSQPPKPSFRIPEGQEGRYANLYSLISTIESLEDEYCNGYITSEEHNKLFSELQSQFNTVQNALNLTTEDIRTFCNHCKLSGSYAFAALFNSTPEISTSLNHSNNVDFTTSCRTWYRFHDVK
ncbi:hypothetical protein GPJ56_000857 [Histomonas meleagridis]|nr:hypothetical protein GPJ56_000857 [Histomonas meleagridis]